MCWGTQFFYSLGELTKRDQLSIDSLMTDKFGKIKLITWNFSSMWVWISFNWSIALITLTLISIYWFISIYGSISIDYLTLGWPESTLEPCHSCTFYLYEIGLIPNTCRFHVSCICSCICSRAGKKIVSHLPSGPVNISFHLTPLKYYLPVWWPVRKSEDKCERSMLGFLTNSCFQPNN